MSAFSPRDRAASSDMCTMVGVTWDAAELDACSRCAAGPGGREELCLYEAVHDEQHFVASSSAN
jgi:hypothetical protein